MFKCKITLEEFDKESKGTPKAELAEVRNLAKACVKKLATAEESKTPFFLSKDYFEDKGKVVGSFLAFGENKKLEMKFAKEEIKGKGTTQNAKGAAYGEAYVKTTNNIKFIYFEPESACKVPVNAWPKLLKSLKPMFGGMKAIVVIEGQTIEEEAGDDEAIDNNVVADNTETTAQPIDKSKETKEERLERKAQNAEILLSKVEQITSIYNFEAKTEFLRKANKWLNEYEQLTDSERTASLKTHFQKIHQAVKKVENILETDKKLGVHMDEIIKALEKFYSMPASDEKSALGKKINASIEKLKPTILAIKDMDLHAQCLELQSLL